MQHLIIENVKVESIATGAFNVIVTFNKIEGLHKLVVSILTLPTSIALDSPKITPRLRIGNGPADPLPHLNIALPGSGAQLTFFSTT